jgi:micrococcal nuclease
MKKRSALIFGASGIVFIIFCFILLLGAEGNTTVYITNTGIKYHRESCRTLRHSRAALTLADAVKSGYGPCGICRPPVPDGAPDLMSADRPDRPGNESAGIYRVSAANLTSYTAADISQMIKGEVVDHVDGDTVRVRIANPPGGFSAVETIRMIGVDTPETVHPRREVEFFGREASEFTKSRLLDRPVYLALDWDTRDRYGRLLAYIYTEDKRCHNADLIREGYGHAYTRFAFQFADEFRALEQQARSAASGLWGASVN